MTLHLLYSLFIKQKTAYEMRISDWSSDVCASYLQGFGGREIPCVDYFPYGSQELGDAAGTALADHSACLLANHGMLARGATLTAAFDNALKLEEIGRAHV